MVAEKKVILDTKIDRSRAPEVYRKIAAGYDLFGMCFDTVVR